MRQLERTEVGNGASYRSSHPADGLGARGRRGHSQRRVPGARFDRALRPGGRLGHRRRARPDARDPRRLVGAFPVPRRRDAVSGDAPGVAGARDGRERVCARGRVPPGRGRYGDVPGSTGAAAQAAGVLDHLLIGGWRRLAPAVRALIFDLDGTLVDTVYAHVFAWQRALTEAGFRVEGWKVHRRIGMSGGPFTRAVAREAGRPLSDDEAKSIQARHGSLFRDLLPQRRPLPRAVGLLP